jgi:aldose 1-epimerase
MSDARISMEYTATVDAPCPVNLTNHAYFNLDGEATDVRRHTLQIKARQFVPINAESIPLGHLSDVKGTSFDFNHLKPIGSDFLAEEQQRLVRGYDHAYLLDLECRDMAAAAATCISGDGRLAMDLYTTKPALQFYSGNYLPGISARHGGVYEAQQGLALETQFLPDSPNHPEWPQPDCWLKPGETYRHTTLLAFRAI